MPNDPTAGSPVSNYEESKVPAYELPDVLADDSGRTAEDAAAWQAEVQPRILQLFKTHIYGECRLPQVPVRSEIRSEIDTACGGLAIRREIRLIFGDAENDPLDVLLYLPKQATGAVPVFIGLNFFGNHTVDPDPSITLSTRWIRKNEKIGVVNHRATEATRGTMARRWPAEHIVSRGYALATAYSGDLVPDHPEGLAQGLVGALRGHRLEREDDEGGAISGWAWGLHRMMDYLQQDEAIDPQGMALIGHSRLGKTALWAGAQDERAALVISNCSGCTGAALSRRCYGETVQRINTNFPHWFALNYRAFGGREHELPVDQHQLLALMAPRALYVASATEDRWADPLGEYLALTQAAKVYRLFGKTGPDNKEPPHPGISIGEHAGYHIRDGIHDILVEDWEHDMNFFEKNRRNNP